MYLKEIKAHGFKSFADVISLNLDSGITGIVGPNGSGKSNIVDAVRWVLGEQSIKSLRGDDKMSDVIFSGSKSRKALNVASVTLVFDNKDHYLPLAFDEISITRRLYKDGSNEYFLNKEHCRLKDIQDLLMDSGIAKESFNIISQGKIEEILSSKPNERRVIFEEAAGVLKYKKRKEEAFRKLERTKENLERVSDIMNELDTTIAPLREQKEIALKYQTLKEELTELELALITSDIHHFHELYDETKTKLETLKKEIESLSTTHQVGETKIETLKLELLKKEEEIKREQHQLLLLTKEVEQLNGQKQILLERKKYEVEDSKLHANLLQLKEQLLQLEESIHVFTQELSYLEQQIKEKQYEVEIIEQERKQVVKQKEMVLKELSQKIKEQEMRKHKITYLKENIESGGNVPSVVKHLLQKKIIQGVVDTVLGLLEVEEQYVTAVTTSLGFVMHHVVVEDSKSAKECISYLKQKQIGRATFLPLDRIQARKLDDKTLENLHHCPGFLGVLSQFVQYNKRYQPIIENLLGTVLLVDTIDHADQIHKQFYMKHKIVTLDGDLFQIGGSITGGSTQKSRTIIQDKYELESLLKLEEEQLKTIRLLEEDINASDESLKQMEEKLYLKTREKVLLTESFHIKQKDKSAYLLSKAQVEEEMKGTNQILEQGLSTEEERVLESYHEKKTNLSITETKLEQLQQAKAKLEEALAEYEFSLKRENSLWNSKNKELSQLEVAYNRYEVKLDTLLTTLNETYNMTYEKAKTLYHLEIDSEIARNKVSNLKREITSLGTVNLGSIEEYERVSTRYEFLLEQYNDLTHAGEVLISIIDEMDQVMEQEFIKSFEIINQHFKQTFQELFKGGYAELKLTDPTHLLETGIEIVASPPGKKLTSISLLSGGEKTFTAISLLFAILKSRPMPFCILDEVEAALDEANVNSFGSYLTTLKEKTQFILITHKKKTMEYVDVLYGITMQESGVSKLVSVKLEELS